MIDAYMIRPAPITDETLISTTASESTPAWNSATTYAIGDRVRSDTTHKIYESAIGSNLNHDPTDADNAPANWIEIGPTNDWAMFDDLKSTQTVASESLSWVLQPGKAVNSVGLARLAGAQVRIVQNDGSDDTYDETYNLVSVDGITDWYSWFFEERAQQETLIVNDLPNIPNPTITITVTGSGDVAVGANAVGRALDIGSPALGATSDYTDYSTYEPDGFGEVTTVERGYSFNEEASLLIENTRYIFVRREILKYRTGPVFVKLSDSPALQAFGRVRQFNLEISYPNQSIASLRIEETLETS